MGISTDVLPDDDPVINVAFCIALDIVNCWINIASPAIYQFAVYNLGGSNIINYAQDQPDAPPVAGSKLPYFEYTRQRWNILGYLSGTISAASDESTSQSMVVPGQAENFTLSDIQLSKDPYGRAYLGFAQKFGQTIFGMT